MTDISKRIFSLMDQQHLTQRDFSRLTGISYNTISDWKRKDSNPAADKIMTICQVLKVTPEYILIGEPNSSGNILIENDWTSGIEELRLIEFFRRLSPAQRKLLWSNLELIYKVKEEADSNSSNTPKSDD